MRPKDLLLNAATGITTLCTVLITSIVIYRQLAPRTAVAQSHREDRAVSNWTEQVASGRRIGPASAAVTLVEYGDFECPACAGFFRTTERVRSAHPNDVSIIFRHAPLTYHQQAYPSARAAECAAEQGQFEAMYRVLYSWRDSLGHVPYRNFAKRAGVADLAKFDQCSSDTKPVPRIEADLKAAEDLKIPGTPGIILNGKLLGSVPSAGDIEKFIESSRQMKQ